MYHTTTPTLVAGAVVTPVVGGAVDSVAGPATAETVVASSTAGAEIAEVLGVKITRGDNPLVDAVHGVATGTLPFTGINVLFLALSAITMILMGMAVVRIGRNLTAASA